MKTFLLAAFAVVVAASSQEVPQLLLTRDQAVEQVLGPEDALYCLLKDHLGNVYYDGFGQCRLSLQSAALDHQGIWSMSVGRPDRITLQESPVTVIVSENGGKAAVRTSVEKANPAVYLSCAVSSPLPARSCKFRTPSGAIYVATEGAQEGRLSFYGAGTSESGGVYTHECGLVLNSTLVEDLGLWRCAIDTADETYFGFLTVLCRWAMSDPAIAASVVSEPTLISERDSFSALEGESLKLSCRAAAPLKYCFFRFGGNGVHGAPGAGSTFPVSSGTVTEDYAYAGAGLDAGECSIRFSKMAAARSGTWSCHVSFLNSHEPEQRVNFNVEVKERIVVELRLEGSDLLVESRAYDERALDYCRFVRMDGLGFTQDTLPEGYTAMNTLSRGVCGLRVPNPSILERHPWTVVARVSGHPEEIFAVSSHGFEFPDVPIAPEPRKPLDPFYIFLIVLGVVGVVAALLLVPRRARHWTLSRATTFRNSVSKGFRVSLLRADSDNSSIQKTPMAA